ncbi:MAG: ATP-binding cassette domain-containing protein [Saprospiraceae bacterium]|nr:ATP-binding cassette domain-containing protein [Saprospiraceae bacterium]
MKSTQRFFRLLALDKKDITYIYLYAVFSGLITLSLPLGTQAIIGLLVGGANSSALYLLIGVIAIGTTLTGILKVMQLTVTETLQRRIFSRASFEFAWRIPRLKLANLSNEYPPELVNRFFDTLTIQKGIPKILIDFSTAVLEIFFGLVLLALYHPLFIFFGLVLFLILIVIFTITGPKGLKTSLVESKYKYKVAYWLEELGRSVKMFKLSSGSTLPIDRADYLVSNYLDARKSHFKILLTQYGAVVLFKLIITTALLVIGSQLVITNQISIGQFVAAEIIIILILGSSEKLILAMETIYDVLTGLEKIGQITDLPLESDQGVNFNEINSESGVRVELENVSFKYADASHPIVSNINLNINTGERICVAGYNGAGKGTLIQLIAGLYDTYEGIVAYNDIPLRSLNLETMRERIGSFLSSNAIFNGTIIENISLGHENIDLKTIIAVAKSLFLHEYVNSLPNGYQTMLLAEGMNVPRSVRVKIILARNTIFNPCLLVMENLLTFIEKAERDQIINFLTDRSKNWTLVAISDDPVFAKKCDRVVIMKEGKIVEDGNFKDLQNKRHVTEIFKLKEEDRYAAMLS